MVGPDDQLAADLEELAETERIRHGHAAASALHERAAQLYAAPEASDRARAAAAEEALLAGDVQRVRAIGADALSGATDPAVRARTLLTLGVLEQYSGSVPRSKQLLAEAAALGTGAVRTRAYAELATVAYRLGSRDTMAAAAADLRASPMSAIRNNSCWLSTPSGLRWRTRTLVRGARPDAAHHRAARG